jgi:hypothetical protein
MQGMFYPDYNDPAVRSMIVVDKGELKWPNPNYMGTQNYVPPGKISKITSKTSMSNNLEKDADRVKKILSKTIDSKLREKESKPDDTIISSLKVNPSLQVNSEDIIKPILPTTIDISDAIAVDSPKLQFRNNNTIKSNAKIGMIKFYLYCTLL